MRLRKQKQQHTEEAPSGASLPLSPVVRVRMLRHAITAWGNLDAGRTLFVPRHVGWHWINDGIAVEDKMLAGATETKGGA